MLEHLYLLYAFVVKRKVSDAVVLCSARAQQIVVRHHMHHEWFERLASKLLSAEPPCCSDAEDWEDAGGWAAELDALAEAAALQPPAMPLDPGESSILPFAQLLALSLLRIRAYAFVCWAICGTAGQQHCSRQRCHSIQVIGGAIYPMLLRRS
jgi:hypothetical protein